jgi:clan AA aspartic protease
VPIEIGDFLGQRWEPLVALVDTGAYYSWVPRSVLEKLDVLRLGRRIFVLADGSEVERELGEARIRLDGQSRATVVVFADDENEALLGSYTLEGFALAVDPVNHRLVPLARLPAL